VPALLAITFCRRGCLRRPVGARLAAIYFRIDDVEHRRTRSREAAASQTKAPHLRGARPDAVGCQECAGVCGGYGVRPSLISSVAARGLLQAKPRRHRQPPRSARASLDMQPAAHWDNPSRAIVPRAGTETKSPGRGDDRGSTWERRHWASGTGAD
jgi:hypothetical protein